MNSGDDPPVFPYEIIWEEFDPDLELDWESLAVRSDSDLIFEIAKSGYFPIPFVDHPMLEALARKALGTELSEPFISKLYVVAAWQVTGEFRRLMRMDLRGQRPELKRLQVAAVEFWKATGRVSGHVKALFPWLHAAEPERLLPRGTEIDLDALRRAAYDVSLVAERAHADTKPSRTGRMPEMRRDISVRFAAEAIGAETGEPLATSRGNNQVPAPHFTNPGGFLLRDFFKLVDPRTDERLVVQSLLRVRARATPKKNSRKHR